MQQKIQIFSCDQLNIKTEYFPIRCNVIYKFKENSGVVREDI